MARSQKDETRYIENMHREEPIKTEVIVELREALQQSLDNNVVLATQLVKLTDDYADALKALGVYRRNFKESVQKAANRHNSCAPHCERHAWDSIKGWIRKNEDEDTE
jgi:hypothetical protein